MEGAQTMRQRLKVFLLLISISFLLVYAVSEYFARRVDAEVEVSNQRLVILYNAHKILFNSNLDGRFSHQ